MRFRKAAAACCVLWVTVLLYSPPAFAQEPSTFYLGVPTDITIGTSNGTTQIMQVGFVGSGGYSGIVYLSFSAIPGITINAPTTTVTLPNSPGIVAYPPIFVYLIASQSAPLGDYVLVTTATDGQITRHASTTIHVVKYGPSQWSSPTTTVLPPPPTSGPWWFTLVEVLFFAFVVLPPIMIIATSLTKRRQQYQSPRQTVSTAKQRTAHVPIVPMSGIVTILFGGMLLVASLWQLEIISIDEGLSEMYCLPFDLTCLDWFIGRDFWYTGIFIAFALGLIGVWRLLRMHRHL